MTHPPGLLVAPSDWVSAAQDLRAEGFDYFDILVAVDRPDAEVVEIVLGVESIEDGRRAFRWVQLPRSLPVVGSLAGVWPAANWHEREIADMYAVEFAGHPDPRPLLLADRSNPAPLRKENVLARRMEVPWPGAVDDPVKKSRRPALPLGVPAAPRAPQEGGHVPG